MTDENPDSGVDHAGIKPEVLQQLFGTDQLNLDFLRGDFAGYGLVDTGVDGSAEFNTKYRTNDLLTPGHGSWHPDDHLKRGEVPVPDMSKIPFNGTSIDDLVSGLPTGRNEAVSPAPHMDWESFAKIFLDGAVPADHSQTWADGATSVGQAHGVFLSWLNGAEDAAAHPGSHPGDDGWSGETGIAITSTARTFEGTLPGLQTALTTQGKLAKAFVETIKSPKDYVDNYNPVYERWRDYYKLFMAGGPHYDGAANTERATNNLNELRRNFADQGNKIIDYFNTNMSTISSHHPDIAALDAPPQPGTPGSTGPGGPGNPGAGGPGPGGPLPDLPAMPFSAEDLLPKTSETPAAQNQTPAANMAGDAAKQAADAAKGVGDQAQGAAQQAADAANQMLDGLLNKPDSAEVDPALMSGALPLLGPTGAGKGGGGVGGGAKGAGIGVGPRAPSATAANAQTSSGAPATNGSRSGLSGAGAPAAGAPAAGHRGGAGGEKEHKANRALRHARHGLVEDESAVVPVVGEDAQTGDAKPA